MTTTENNKWETVDFVIHLSGSYKRSDQRWKVTYLPNREAFVAPLWSADTYAYYSAQSKTWVSTHRFPNEVKAVVERLVSGKINKVIKES